MKDKVTELVLKQTLRTRSDISVGVPIKLTFKNRASYI